MREVIKSLHGIGKMQVYCGIMWYVVYCGNCSKNLVPESSIARRLLHAQCEESKWAESVVDRHLDSIIPYIRYISEGNNDDK